ncbi:MAG: heavy-metal-associated domain-containing protein [Flavobacteriales bacterium]|nr:heavy-metal-associated domain-containing protein [Flavobacteriales bacterium]
MKIKNFGMLFTLGLVLALINIQATVNVKEVSFWVDANCDHCKERIENAVDVKGVKMAEFDLDDSLLTVVYKPEVITLDKLHQLVAAAGHDTKKVKATAEAYENITKECCKYRDTSCKKSCTDSCKKKH